MLRDGLEYLMARALIGGIRVVPWPRALGVGAALGAMLERIGVRRRVARANLEIAFPDATPERRAAILAAHYRELGRVAIEYVRLPELVGAAGDRVVAGVAGLEHLEAARAAGRGAILLTGHFGNFELLGAWLGRLHPVDFVVRPLRNRPLGRWLERQRRASGVGVIDANAGIRAVYRALAENRWVPMLGDQDARRHGVFVPFFGRLASTPTGPARIALATGAPIVTGFAFRGADGRHHLDLQPPLWPDGAADAEGVERLTALHARRLEDWVRRHPASWFWLHRRWKTPPPAREGGGAGRDA